MPPRLPDDKREAILTDIRTETLSCGAIARKHGVSTSTVSRLAKATGAGDAWQRSKTVNATQGRVIDTAALRTEAEELFLRRAVEELKAMDQPCLVYSFGGKDNDYNEHLLDKPGVGERRTMMTSAAIAIDKHLAIVRHDAASNSGQVGALLTDLFEDLRARHDGGT